ncbi:hypothetical protein RI367_003070 [Sorochytrium milnesiophthora]
MICRQLDRSITNSQDEYAICRGDLQHRVLPPLPEVGPFPEPSAIHYQSVRGSMAITDITSASLLRVCGEYVYFRGRHTTLGAVLIKCCPTSASASTIAKLRWEYYVTRTLKDIDGIVLPFDALDEFESSPFSLVFPQFPLPRLPGRRHSDQDDTDESSSDCSVTHLAAAAEAFTAPHSRLVSTDTAQHSPLTKLPQANEEMPAVQLDSRAFATTLDDYIQQHHTLTLEQAVELLRQLVRILSDLHQKGIIYRNFSFSTVILYADSDDDTSDWSKIRVALSDFSYATKLSGEQVSPATANFISCGDRCFMSPESTGRMNRGVDCRSDFYSLGMLVHAALTGSRLSDDMSVLNTIHYHIAVLPVPLRQHYDTTHSGQTNIRLADNLQRVLETMYAKWPENRYRTCGDIQQDIDRLSSPSGMAQNFAPHTSCNPSDVLTSAQLYGRSEEVTQVTRLLKDVQASSVGGILIVSGCSGVGKTSLVQELVLPTFKAGGVYCFGKFDMYRRDQPFSAFSKASADLINLLLLEDRSVLDALTKSLQSNLGDNLGALTSVIPNLEHLMGSTIHSLPQASGTDALSRTQQSLMAFLETVAQFKPLTMFIDDVQWADASSSRFMMHIVSERMPRRILFVMAYRSEEIHLNHQLEGLTLVLRRQAEEKRILLSEQHLSNMQPQHIADMLVSMFQHAEESAQDISGLVALVYEKTLGNAFYVRRFLQSLLETNALRPVQSANQWTWDLEQIRMALPMDNVVDLLVSELGALPSTQQLALMVASLVGSTFKLNMLARLLQASELSAWDQLLGAASCGYIHVLGGLHPSTDYDGATSFLFADMAAFLDQDGDAQARRLTTLDDKTLDKVDGQYTLSGQTGRDTVQQPSITLHDADDAKQTHIDVCYQWEHDRIQEAAYQLIPETQRSVAHLTIGRWMLRTTSDDELDECVFEIVHHLMKAEPALSDKQDRINLAKLLLFAASKAKCRSAFDASLQYSKEAIRLLQAVTWQSHYGLMFAAHQLLIEAEYSTNSYPAMKLLLDHVKQQSLLPDHRTLICELEIHYYTSQSQVQNAVTCGLSALATLGYALSTDEALVAGLMQRTTIPLADISKLIKLPFLTDVVAHSAARLLVTLIPPVYFCQPALLTPVILTLVDISIAKGNSEYGAYGLLLAGFLGNIPAAYEYGKLSLQVLEIVPPSPLRCQINKVFASHVQCWVEPAQNTFASFEVAIAAGKTWMNSEYLGYGISEVLFYKLFAGVPIPRMKMEMSYYRGTIESLKQPIASNYYAIMADFTEHISRKRLSATAGFASKKTEAAILTSEIMTVKMVYWLARVMLHCYADEIAEARAGCAEADQLAGGHMGTLFHSEYLFYKGVVLIRSMLAAPADTWEPDMSQLKEIVDKFRTWAAHCPSTFGCRLELLSGCMMWLQKDTLQGVDAVDRAIELARQHSFVNVEALASEMAAKMWLWCNKKHIASVYLTTAHRCYKMWGAEWKARLIRHTSDISMIETPPGTPYDETGFELDPVPVDNAQCTTAQVADLVDVEMISNWTVALASEKTHEALMEQYMRLCALYSGARKGCLFWTRDHGRDTSDLSDMVMTVSLSLESTCTLQTTLSPTVTHFDMASVANYAIRTKEVVTDGSAVVATFVQSGQIASQTGSFLFHPVVHHGVCIGLLYLANDLSHKAFMSSKRMSLLKLLSSQLNISFENMRLLEELRSYNEALQKQTVTLEAMVQQRTQDLETTNRQLVQQVAEREKAEAVAKQAAAANRSFLHTMSHELRTPLNCIIGMTELLSQMQLNPEQLDLLRPIQTSAKDLLQIINDILDLSKIESGKLVLLPEDCSLRDIVDDAVDSVSSQAAEKSVALITLYPDSVPSRIHQDGTRVGQVLRNLLSNAAKFTSKGEIVMEVSSEPIPDRDVHRFTIKCIDAGIGIPADQMDKLFKPFSQVDGSLSRKFGGTGLGLNISVKFAEKMAGTLTCTSTVDVGSTFTFTFEAAVVPTPRNHTAVPSNVSFVLCHPSALVRQMLTGYLDFNNNRIQEVDESLLQTYQADVSRTVCILDKKTREVWPGAEQDASMVITIDSDWSRDGSGEGKPAGQSVRLPLRQSRLLKIVATLFHRTPVRPTQRPHILRPQFSLRVLMAEDSLVNRSVADRMLRKFGIVLEMVENGALAVDACLSREWDLVFMDVMMPVMDGHEATRQIRQQLPDERQPKVIALTANAFAEDKAACFEAGMDDVLTKPITFQTIEAMLLAHFSPT